MRLSFIFELLLFFLIVAFAAYARVIDSKGVKKLIATPTATSISLKQAAENVNKYCVCNENICNCCRDFHIPLVQLAGPGCASLQYLQENKLAMQLSIGDNILSSNVVNGNNPKPVCVNLPGGFSKFCGKIYSIKKEADKHFKACLGLELRSASELEASLRVSCFRFGPDGLKLRPAEPLPPTVSLPSTNAADDDYDDLFSLDDDEDDEDDDEETDNDEKVSDPASTDSVAAEQQNQEQAAEDDDEDDDLLGLSALLDIFTGDDDSTTNKKTKPTSTPIPSFTIPILSLTTTASPVIETHSNEVSTTAATLNKASTASVSIAEPQSTPSAVLNNDNEEISTEKIIETTADTTADTVESSQEDDTQTTEVNNVPVETKKVVSNSLEKKSKLNSTEIKQADKKKVSITTTKLQSNNKIKKQGPKPPVTESNTEVDDSSETLYDDEDDEDDQNSEENSNDSKEHEAEKESDKTVNGTSDTDDDDGEEEDETYDESDEDDDDEDENADVEVMSTLLEDEVSTEKTANRKDKTKTNKKKTKVETTTEASDDDDYELSEILGRKYHADKKGVKRKITHIHRQSNK